LAAAPVVSQKHPSKWQIRMSEAPKQDSAIADLESRLAKLIESRIELGNNSGESARCDSSQSGRPGVLGGADEVTQVLAYIRSLAAARHRPVPVAAYLGPQYSYSHLAASQYFGEGAPLLPVSTIAAVFEAVIAGDCAQGIVPIENSTDGRVVDTISRLITGQTTIVGEIRLPIHHCLLSASPRESIVEIQSKPQALSQCRGYLSRHFPDAKLTPVASTASAANEAAKTPGVAAVASLQAGRHYGLNIIAENIEDNRDNLTRFIVLGLEPARRTGNDKTSLLFQVKHQPGSLADVMMVFKEKKLNLTFIESFPMPSECDEYLFVVELQGHCEDQNVAEAIHILKSLTDRMVILGSYPKAL
jgi:chorismate mutase / prephenate dehydratase